MPGWRVEDDRIKGGTRRGVRLVGDVRWASAIPGFWREPELGLQEWWRRRESNHPQGRTGSQPTTPCFQYSHLNWL
jgi:hypothetical protein